MSRTEFDGGGGRGSWFTNLNQKCVKWGEAGECLFSPSTRRLSQPRGILFSGYHGEQLGLTVVWVWVVPEKHRREKLMCQTGGGMGAQASGSWVCGVPLKGLLELQSLPQAPSGGPFAPLSLPAMLTCLTVGLKARGTMGCKLKYGHRCFHSSKMGIVAVQGADEPGR